MEVLLAHKARSSCSDAAAFVFAGRSGDPLWPDNVLADYPKPAAAKAGVGSIGWHTFTYTYSTLLHSLGARPIVQKELLRHADVTTMLSLYTQAISTEKRETTSKVVDVLWRN
jgi:integrase